MRNTEPNPDNREKMRELGRKGGRATVEKYGIEHMRKIGKKGAQVTHAKYNLEPYKQSRYCLVDRETREIKAIW